MKVIYNNNIFDQSELFISPLARGFNYGQEFFTTIKVINKVPENLNLHINRIKKSLKYFSFNFELPDIDNLIKLSLDMNNLTDARIKITFFRDLKSISYILYCEKLVIDNKPVDLKISEFIRGNNELFRYKSLNYYLNLNNGLSIYKDCKNRVLETGFANIFIIKKNQILTPSKKLAILSGTYREFLLKKKNINGYRILEKNIYLKDLKKCEEVFITNAIRGLVPVKKIDKREYGTTISKELIRSLNAVTK